ncbi:MAG: sugar transferase [Clostridia bacterium]
MYRKYFKRLFDVICSLLALIVLSPVLLVTAILVRFKLGSPVIFRQKRPGLHEKIFTLYKFRTMTDQKDEQGNLLPDEVRLTKFGKMLRSTSLDELPELWNILKGNMSIVGPRPLLIKDMVFMTDVQRERHIVRPGLTGLAQVNGRNAISWEAKLQYDLDYLSRITFLRDLALIFRTLYKTIRRDGISEEGKETAMDLGDYLLDQKKISISFYKEMQIKAQEVQC